MEKLDFNLLKDEIKYVINNQAFNEAFECYNLVEDWLQRTNIKHDDSRSYNIYQDYLIKLKFLALNFFETGEYPELLKDYANLAFEISGFNLWEKIETELIAMEDVDARDDLKQKLKTALEQCNNILTSSSQDGNPKYVSEWIKDFVVNLGLDKFDKLKKAEYLTNGKSLKSLADSDKDKVKSLLDLYENLNLSSTEKEGYENSVMMNIDGAPVIFHRGNVEILKPIDVKVEENDNNKNISDVLGDAKSNLKVDSTLAPVATSVEPSVTQETVNSILSEPAQKPIVPRTTELEEILNSYSPSSLEYKAISQEILRLKKASARKDAKR